MSEPQVRAPDGQARFSAPQPPGNKQIYLLVLFGWLKCARRVGVARRHKQWTQRRLLAARKPGKQKPRRAASSDRRSLAVTPQQRQPLRFSCRSESWGWKLKRRRKTSRDSQRLGGCRICICICSGGQRFVFYSFDRGQQAEPQTTTTNRKFLSLPRARAPRFSPYLASAARANVRGRYLSCSPSGARSHFSARREAAGAVFLSKRASDRVGFGAGFFEFAEFGGVRVMMIISVAHKIQISPRWKTDGRLNRLDRPNRRG